MKTFKFEVTELHEVKKIYYIEAKTKGEALRKARYGDWDDASPDEFTGHIHSRKIVYKRKRIK